MGGRGGPGDHSGNSDQSDNPDESDNSDRSDAYDLFISPDGRVFDNPQDAIAACLVFEETSGTGVGCGQDPDNVPGGSPDEDGA